MGLTLIHVFIVILAGVALGSFASALSWRVPRGISWTHGRKNQQDKNGVARSACVHCHTTLTLPDLVPLLSWLFLRGKCRHCGKFIGWRYPLMEGLTLLGCIGIYIVWGFHPGAFILMAAVSILVALLFIDLEHMILPDQLNAILAGLAILLILYHLGAYGLSYGFGDKAISKVMGAALYGGLAWGTGWGVGKILKKNALGFGDVKFFAVAGLWLGWAYLPYFLLASGVIGVIFGGVYKIILKKQEFPFGPALILALYGGMLLEGLEIVPLIGIQ